MTGDGRTVLVTGGAGFIGSHVAGRFVAAGDDVHVLDNLFAGVVENAPAGATLHRVDLRDDAIARAVDDVGPDVVVHLAAIHYIPYCNEHPAEAYEVNAWGTRALLDASLDSDLDDLVYASTAAVYPPRSEPHREADATGPMDVYGRSKLIGEDLVQRFAAETGTPTTSLRLFNVFGTRETNPHLVPAIVEQLKRDGAEIKLGNLTPKRDFVHVTDVARAVEVVVDAADDGYSVYNVGSGSAYSVREVVEATGAALGTRISVEQDSDRVRESDRPHLQASIDRISEELGWQPEVGLEEGLAELLAARDVQP